MNAPRNRVRGIAELPAARVENSPGNWRTHDAAQKDKMRGLLGEVGSVSELVVWIPDDEAREALRRAPGADGFAAWLASFTGKVRLLDGHMRKGLRGKRLGVQITDLDAREAALVLATFDPIGAQAGRDDKLLRELLDGQRSENRGLEALLDDLRASVGAPASGAEPDLDEGPAVDPTDEILAKWAALGVAPGSLWEVPSADGQRVHRVLCGDARKPEDVERLMQGRTPALGNHDVPYGVKERTDRGAKGRGKMIGSTNPGAPNRRSRALAPAQNFRPVEGDAEPFDPAHLLATGHRLILWGANHYASRLPDSKAWLIWDKREGTPSDDNADGEAAWTNLGGPLRIIGHKWRGLIKASERGEKRLAPTQKPVAVMVEINERWTKPGEILADWYMGSGPVLLACERTGRIGYGMDITPRYVAVTLERLTRAGLTPRRIG